MCHQTKLMTEPELATRRAPAAAWGPQAHRHGGPWRTQRTVNTELLALYLEAGHCGAG